MARPIVILGGGVAGVALAWALAAVFGRSEVHVYDPRPMGSPDGSTAHAAGGFRTQFATPLNIALSLRSRAFYTERATRVDFQSTGYLYLARHPGAVEELAARAEIQRAAGLPVEHPYPPAAVRALVPFLGPVAWQAAAYCALDGVYRPPLVLRAFVDEARTAGAAFHYETPIPDHALGDAEAVVIAAGRWSADVGGAFGAHLPVERLERGVFQVGPFDWLHGRRVPMTIDADSGYHFRERDGRLLVMFPGDPHDWTAVQGWLARWVPAAAVEHPEDHWSGFYEMTLDHHPLVGETERSGVWAVCGFSGHGVMHAPAIAECLAAMILGQSPPIDLSALSPRRAVALVDRTTL